MYKYGIFMGSFDPVHNAHACLVRYAAARLVETVVVVPCHYNPHKINPPASFDKRVDMLKINFDTLIRDGKVIVDTIENDISRELKVFQVPSWMTLQRLKKKYDDFVILTTIETMESMPTWSNPTQLEQYKYIVFSIDDEITKFKEGECKQYDIVGDIITGAIIPRCQGIHSTHIRNGSDSLRKQSLHCDVYAYIKRNKMYPLKRNWCYTIPEGEHKGITMYSGRFTAVTLIALTEIDKQVCVLANKRGPGCPDYNGYWNMPCGYVEANETTKEAAAREAFEECCIDIDPDDIVYYGLQDEPAFCNKGNITIRYYTWVTTDKNKIPENPKLTGEKDEVDEIRWIPLAEYRNYQWAFGHEKLIKEFYEWWKTPRKKL